MTDPLSPIGLLAPAIVGTLVNLCSEAGVNRALSTIASRQLSLGNLDANHDIARAARVAQVNAAIVLLRSAQEAEPRTEFINGGFYIPADVAKPFSVADAKLRRIAMRIENADPKEFAGMFGEGALAEVQSAVQLLLATEQSSRYQSARDTLRELALQEVTALGGWTVTPKSLSEAFSNFEGAFAASVGALIKSPSFDAFFRILLVLKQEAIDQNIQLVLQSLPELSSMQAERTKAAQSIAGGLQKLQAFEDSLLLIAQTVAVIDATTRQTNERVSQFSEKLDQLLALGLTSEERISYKREIRDLQHELGLKDDQAIEFLSSVLKQRVAPQDIAEAYRLATTQFQALVAELNRKSNLPSEVQRDRDAARAALAEAEFEKARTHLIAAAEATRRTAEHAASEYAQSLASLGALAFVELNFSEARRFYGDALKLPGLSEDRLSRYRRSFLVASNAVMARNSFGRARKVLEEMITAGVQPNEVTYNTLINLADSYAEGRKVLEEMITAGVQPDEVTYNTLINLADSYAEGRKVLEEMITAGVQPDEFTYSTLINLADSYAEGRKVLEEMITAGVQPNEVTYSTLINLADSYAEGRKVLEEMITAGVQPNEVTYNTLINLADSYAEGRKVLEEMITAGVQPNEVTYNTLINLADSYAEGRKVLEEMITAGVQPDEVTYSTLINLSDSYAEGRKVLEEMITAGVQPNEFTYSTLINLSDSYAEGRKVLEEMITAGVQPNEVTYSTLINLADSYAEGRKVLEEMITAGVQPDEFTYSTLINLSDSYAEGRKVLEEMITAGVQPNEVTYSTLINLADSYAEGRKVLEEMITAGVQPNEVTLITLVKKAPTFEVGYLFAFEAQDGLDWPTRRGFYQALFSLPIIHQTAEELLTIYASLPFRYETALESPIRQYRSQKRFDDVITICLYAPHLPAAQKFYREHFDSCREYLLGRLVEGIDSDNLHYCLGIACHMKADWERAALHLQIALDRAHAAPRIKHINQLLASIPK